MGCSINSQYKKVQNTGKIGKISSVNQIKVDPGLFVKLNPNAFQDVYKIGAIISTNQVTEIRECFHHDTGEKRAVKITKKLQGSEKIKLMHKSELKILKKIDHPNIVRVFEYFEDSRRFYTVMEYCNGGELLEELLKQDFISEISIAKIMKQIFSALFYLHSQNIMHRNLKPENILLEEKDMVFNIKIIDFGSAITNKSTVTGRAGSPYFAAPEVHLGSYSVKADIWSAGVILSTLLSGNPPYVLTGTQKFKYLTADQYFGFSDESWNRTSVEAKDLLKKMLVSETHRISAQECLNHKWIIEKTFNPICNQSILDSVLMKLKAFHSYHKLREAVCTFIISQIVSLKETKMLREVFRTIDKNCDGKVSAEELSEQYSQTLGFEEANKEALRIIKEVDSDNNGFIDYTEFLKVNLDSKRVLSNENLKLAFKMFDKDASGTISATELKNVLGGDLQSDESVWQEFILMADQNNDGEIDLQEFQDMILSNCFK